MYAAVISMPHYEQESNVGMVTRIQIAMITMAYKAQQSFREITTERD